MLGIPSLLTATGGGVGKLWSDYLELVCLGLPKMVSVQAVLAGSVVSPFVGFIVTDVNSVAHNETDSSASTKAK